MGSPFTNQVIAAKFTITIMTSPEIVLDLIEAFRRSKAMFAAVSMGIFDRLENREATAAELAVDMDADIGASERLLDACASLGLLRKDGARYSNTPTADAYLRRRSP